MAMLTSHLCDGKCSRTYTEVIYWSSQEPAELHKSGLWYLLEISGKTRQNVIILSQDEAILSSFRVRMMIFCLVFNLASGWETDNRITRISKIRTH